MSIDACGKCGRFIDTDENPDAYEVTDEDCNTIKLEYALCNGCKDNFTGAIEFKKRVDAFTGDVFDWVSLLGQAEFLGRCYQFQAAINDYINPKKKG